MSLTEWAENEVRLIREQECEKCKNDDDNMMGYVCLCYESALKAYRSLMEDGHSGMSFNITKNILTRLMDELPLTPIEDTDDVWYDTADISGLHGEKVNYQCKRRSSLFKYIYADGSVKYHDINRVYGTYVDNPSNTYTTGLITRIYDEMYPITMPYMPKKPVPMYTEDFLYDINNGDFDTIGLLYIIDSSGNKIEVNRFFKESDKGFVEIDESEYLYRKKNACRKEEINSEEK